MDLKKLTLISLTVLQTTLQITAQDIWSRPNDLRREITKMDSILFNAFNNCDIETLEKLHAEDLEFYHDLTGLTNGRQSFIESVKNGVCKGDVIIKRTLMKETMQVYPLNNFGAIQINDHRFDILVIKTEEKMTSVAKTIVIWKLIDGQWQIARTMSYDHKMVDSK